MTLDLRPIRAALRDRDRVARVVVTSVRGSTPREAGTAMLVWDDARGDGQSGTIGGGTLEWEAAAAARDALAAGAGRAMTRALGPELGQCCGGAVGLAVEIWDADRLARAAAAGTRFTRALADTAGPCPAGLAEAEALALDGLWLSEPLAAPGTPLWVWGAGHVGRAIVPVMAPMPGWAITWADTGAQRFPDMVPEGVETVWAQDLARLAANAPQDACHLIVTHSHALDLALCDAALRRGFGFCGLIGSATKKARFARRLAQMAHSPRAIARITCPIGQRDLGKHPAQIAVGVAAELLGVQAGAATLGLTEKTGT